MGLKKDAYSLDKTDLSDAMACFVSVEDDAAVVLGVLDESNDVGRTRIGFCLVVVQALHCFSTIESKKMKAKEFRLRCVVMLFETFKNDGQ
jgi:hypothetical protein